MKNTISDNTLQNIYSAYATMALEEFRAFCLNLVKNARQVNHEMAHKIPSMRSKDQLLQAVNNFAMKGQGFGVIGGR